LIYLDGEETPAVAKNARQAVALGSPVRAVKNASFIALLGTDGNADEFTPKAC
jgi:hypothetical protein